MTLNEAIQTMTGEIVSVLADNKPTIYLFGSVALDDFKLGWSDIDIVVLTEHEISEQHAETLVGLRQALLERYLGNLYFRLFEGGILSVDAFLNGKNERTVYWGTSGQRITDNYKLDSFGMAELLDNGILLYGDEIRREMAYPTYAQMRDDIAHHVRAARKHGVVVGWLLDIARGIYTLRTGKIIAKTAAGEWALVNSICPDEEAMKIAVKSRKEAYLSPEKSIDNSVIQRFADVIDDEFSSTTQRLAESELQYMGVVYNTLTKISDKDGVSVWRVITDSGSLVMKCFDKPEYRREITNYQVLSELNIPTLKIEAHTNCSILLEDINNSSYRLGIADDMNDTNTARLVAQWYKKLHENGQEYANTHLLYDECDYLTIENITETKATTDTSALEVWEIIEKHFEVIKSAAMNLPRTLTYNDFYYTNLAVAKNGTTALVFDYNLLGKGYVYGDIRNVCSSLGDEAKASFLSAYGDYDKYEKIVDEVVSPLTTLHFACQRESFPAWANDELEKVKDGRLLAAVEKLLRHYV